MRKGERTMAADFPRSPVTAGSSAVPATARLSFAPVEGAKELFTPQFVEYLAFLHECFTHKIHRLPSSEPRCFSVRCMKACSLPTPHAPRSLLESGTSLRFLTN